jgi:hypothetical protein
MKTAIFLVQDANQTPILQSLIEEACRRGYTRFHTAMLLDGDRGMVFSIEAESIDDFPLDNLFRADRILLVDEPLPWLCDRGEEVFAVWDGCEGETLSCLGFLKAWGIPGTYINPCRTFTLDTI